MEKAVTRRKWTAGLLITGTVALVVAFWSLIMSMLSLLAVAGVLTLLSLPLCKVLEKRLPGGAAAAIALLTLLGAVLGMLWGLIPPLLRQSAQLMSRLPALLDSLRELLTRWSAALEARGIPLGDMQAELFSRISAAAGQLAATLVSGIRRLTGSVSQWLLAPLLSFYFLRDRKRFCLLLSLVLPVKYRARGIRAAREMRRESALYLRGQLILSLFVAAMTALGTAADVALVPGLVGAAVEVVVIIVLMNIYINKARAKGEHFELHPLDPHYDKNTPRPNFWIALIPLVALFVTFNILKININICVIGSTVLSILLFWKQLKAKNLRELISTGAADSIHMSLTVAAICGFAGVVTNTEAFTTMLNAITGINMSPMLICAVVVAVMCMLTGGSSTGQLISLPLIAPKLLDLGLNVNAIHRIACFAATTLDSMPYSGAILMLLPMCRMKLKEIYPPMFITTVIATTCGTIAVIVMCALFPGLC